MPTKSDRVHSAALEVPVVASLPGAEIHEQVAAFTRKLFGSSVTIEQEADPEFSDSYFVVSATGTGDIELIADLEQQWRLGIRESIGELARYYRLFVGIR